VMSSEVERLRRGLTEEAAHVEWQARRAEVAEGRVEELQRALARALQYLPTDEELRDRDGEMRADLAGLRDVLYAMAKEGDA